jgi:hypothetical protein
MPNDEPVTPEAPSDDPGFAGDFDPERARRTIDAARNGERVAKGNARRYADILHKLGVNVAALDPSIGDASEPPAEPVTPAEPTPDPRFAQLAEALGVDVDADLVAEVTALKARRIPRGANTAEFKGGQSLRDVPQIVSREQLKYLTPEAIVDLRRAGLVEGVTAAD